MAAVCGLVTGFIEWGASYTGQTGKVTLDVTVGVASGLITGLVYNHMGESLCMSSVSERTADIRWPCRLTALLTLRHRSADRS